jgi:hypothetical protein
MITRVSAVIRPEGLGDLRSPGRLRAAGQRTRRARRALAVDGKAVRGTRHASSDGQPVHLLAVIDQQASAVLGQVGVDGKTNEITQFAPLLEYLDLAGCVITADALHTQRDHAEFLVTKKHAHYILVVKKNQPSLYAQVKNLPWRNIPAGDRQHDCGHGREEHRTLKAAALAPGSASRAPPRPSASPAGSGPCPVRRSGATCTVYAVTSLTAAQAARPARCMDPRALADRGAAPHPRRQLRRRRLPGPHRERPAGHGHFTGLHRPAPRRERPEVSGQQISSGMATSSRHNLGLPDSQR